MDRLLVALGIKPSIDGKEKRLASLEKQIADLELRRKDLAKNLRLMAGRNDQFLPLKSVCFSKQISAFTYEVCLLDRATRKENEEQISIGYYDTLMDGSGDTPSEKVVMEFAHGGYCASGPRRSTRVTIECGSETRVLSADEMEPCVYTVLMTSPAACVFEEGPKDEL